MDRYKKNRIGSVRTAFGVLAALLLFFLLSGQEEVWAGYEPNPQTTFAVAFIQAAEGEQWFLDEVERLLNMEQSTLDRIEGTEDLKRITSLGIADKGIEGKIPKAIGYLENLKYLFGSGNRLSGDLPDEFYTLENLINVDLSDNLYEGEIPSAFSRLTNLEVLRLSGNRYTGSIPVALTTLPNLRTLDLSGNYLTGGIPSEIAGMTTLEYLDVSCNNQLGGTLPASITTMGNLKVFAAWNCGLTGEIPGSIGDMSSLQMLDLAENSLTGELPAGIGGLGNLMELCITDNDLVGTMPDVFSGMDRLIAVHADRNYLRGHIPDSLYQLFDGKVQAGEEIEVTFSGNYMTGDNALRMEEAQGTYVSEKNFVDGSSGTQYQLSGPSYYAVSLNTQTDLFSQLKNIVASGSTSEIKAMRPFEDYEVSVDTGTLPSCVTVTTTGGIYFTTTEAIAKADAIPVTIWIKANDGSAYSTWTILVGTEKTTTSGGGSSGSSSSGSSSTETSGEEEEVVETERHLPYISGYEDGTVKPDQQIAREEAAVMLSRILGEEEPEQPVYSSFIDTEKDRWSSGYIDYARKMKLLSGYPDGTFRPADSMTRNEFAVLLCNLTGRTPLSEAPEDFLLTDVPSDWAEGYVYAAYSAGYISGYEDGTFRGSREVSRAEAAAMLNNAMRRSPDAAYWETHGENPYSDLQTNHWAYYDILEASITHEHAVSEADDE